jgi:DNA-binding CsgD family transcriptional regulator
MSVERIRELYEKGYMYKDIARELGISERTLVIKIYAMQKLGLLQPRRKASRHLPVDDIARLYLEGKRYEEIAKTLNLNFSTLTSILSILHKIGKVPYRMNARIIQTNFRPTIEKLIQSSGVFGAQDFLNALKKEGMNVPQATAVNILESLCESGELNKLNIKYLKGFLPRNSPNIIYYVNHDALIEYLLKHLHVHNRKSFISKLTKVKLPNDVRRRLTLAFKSTAPHSGVHNNGNNAKKIATNS